MLFLKILRILNGIFVISVALSAAARIFPIFRNKRTVMVNLFVLGMAGILTSLLFKQFSMVFHCLDRDHMSFMPFYQPDDLLFQPLPYLPADTFPAVFCNQHDMVLQPEYCM